MKTLTGKKSDLKVTYKDYIFLGLFFIAILFVVSSCLIYRDVLIMAFKDSNIASGQPLIFEKELGREESETESVYTIKANPNQAQAKVITLKLKFENAEVLGFETESKFFVIGTCDGGKKYLSNKVCADLGITEGTINNEEKLGSIKLKFNSDQEITIKSEKGNGFYNGTELVLNENLSISFKPDFILPLTGEEESSFDLTNYPLFLAVNIFIILVGFGGFVFLMVKKDKKIKEGKAAKIVSIFGILFLMGGTFFIINNISNKNLSIGKSNALAQITNSKYCNTIQNATSDVTKVNLYNTYYYKSEFPSGKVKNQISINGTLQNADPPSYDIDSAYSFQINKTDKVVWRIADMNSSDYKDCLVYTPDTTPTCNQTPNSCPSILPCCSGICGLDGKCRDCVEDNRVFSIKKTCCNGTEPINMNPGWKCLTGNSCSCNASLTELICTDTYSSMTCAYGCDPNLNKCNTTPSSGPDIAANCQQIKNNGWLGGAGYYCSVSPEGWLITCAADGTPGNTGAGKKCSGTCVKQPAGTPDYCSEDAAPSGGVEPTSNPINNPTQAVNTTDGGIACGNFGCTKDEDCEGFKDNKTEGSTSCDEVVGNDPSKQKCVKICKYGFENNNVCSCSQTPPPTETDCGPMDANDDKIINYIDMYAFIKVYNKSCNGEPLSSWSCGGQDSNNDKFIDYKDEYAMVANYYPLVANCTGMPGSK